MEVGTLNISYPAATNQPAPQAIEGANVNPAIEKAREIANEKVMMDLQDVQQFLYMLIGSEIKVSSGNNVTGQTVNTMA